MRPANVNVNIERGNKNTEGELEAKEQKRSSEAEIYDTEEVEITCRADDGLPEPKIHWFLNTKLIDIRSNEFKDKFELIGEDGPKESPVGSHSHMQKLKYTANINDNGKFIQCQALQVDDENNENWAFNAKSKFQLYIKAVPLPEGPVVTAAMIGSIIGIIIILILLFLLLAFAWYTKKWCFATPITVLSPEKRDEERYMAYLIFFYVSL